MKGNEALAEAAIIAGCRHYFGYPITPQNEIPSYFARRMPEVGGTFLQAESEIAAINMAFGASSGGARVMTSSSSPGISLKQEGISFFAGARLPCVIVNMMRGGPGLGGIAGAQGDYFQATRGGGHGDYRNIVLAPSSVQEMADLGLLAFDLADTYRIVVMILGDGYIGQMAEPLTLPEANTDRPGTRDYITDGCEGREPRFNGSLKMGPETVLKEHVKGILSVYPEIIEKERRCECYMCEDAEVIITAYGIAARICKGVVQQLRNEGIRAGLFRPITLWPYPAKELLKVSDNGVRKIIVVEMSDGQMIEDVKLSIQGRVPIEFYGELGGVLPDEETIKRMARNHE